MRAGRYLVMTMLIGAVLLPASPARADQKDWIVLSGSGNFSDNTRWDLPPAPTAADDADLPTHTSPYTVTVQTAENITIQSLGIESNATLLIAAGGTLTVTQAVTIATGGTLAVAGALTVGGALQNSGTLKTQGAGPTSITGAITNQAVGTFDVDTSVNVIKAGAAHSNAGTVDVAAGATLAIASSDVTTTHSFTNTGTVTLASGSAMKLTGGTWTHTSGAVAAAASPAPAVTIEDATIGVSGTDAGRYLLLGDNTLAGDVAASKELTIMGTTASGGAKLTSASGFINNGQLILGSDALGVNAELEATTGAITSTLFNGSLETLAGAGKRIVDAVMLGNCEIHIRGDTEILKSFTNGYTTDVHEGGILTLTGGTTHLTGTTLSGFFRVEDGTLDIPTGDVRTLTGTLELSGGASFFDSDTGAGLADLVAIAGSASFRLSDNQFLTLAGGLGVNGGGLSVSLNSELTVNGHLTQTGGIVAVGTTTGILDIQGAGNQYRLRGGRLEGNGVVEAPVVNTGGILAPGGGTFPLHLTESYVQGPTGTFEHTIVGTGLPQRSWADVDGNAKLDGVLRFITGGGARDLGETYDVIEYGSRTGTFSILRGTKVPFNGFTTCTSTDGACALEVSYGAAKATATIVDTQTQKSDGLIRSGRSYLGQNRYNGTGVKQTSSARVRRTKKKTFLIRAQVDGNIPDKLLIDGEGSKAGFTVRYLKGARGNTNITKAVVNGTYKIAELSVGELVTIRLEVKVKATTPVGRRKSWLTKVISSVTAAARDAVKAKVTARA